MKYKIVLLIFLLFFILSLNYDNSDDGIIYIDNFLDKKDFETVSKLNKNKNLFAFEGFRYRRGLKDKKIYDIFYGEKYMNKIQKKLNNKIYKSDFPIEHRIYYTKSPGMQWHSDTLLYEKPQYEVIYTISNNSKSVTQWKDKNGKIHDIFTKPNSLLIIRAQGYEHRVTKPLVGEKEILKLIYTQTHKKNKNYYHEIKSIDKIN